MRIREISVIENHLLPITECITYNEYRENKRYEVACLDKLRKLGYREISRDCGACSTVWRKGLGRHLIKVLRSDGCNIPLDQNPTRELWEKIVADGLEDSDQFVEALVRKPNRQKVFDWNYRFRARWVKYFLFHDYIHSDGLFAVQKFVDATNGRNDLASGLFRDRVSHDFNYGMDGDRPVIIDWW